MKLPVVVLLLLILASFTYGHEFTIYPVYKTSESPNNVQMFAKITCQDRACTTDDEMNLKFPPGAVVTNFSVVGYTNSRVRFDARRTALPDARDEVGVWFDFAEPIPAGGEFRVIMVLVFKEQPELQDEFDVTLSMLGTSTKARVHRVNITNVVAAPYLSVDSRSPTHGYNTYHTIENLPTDVGQLQSISVTGAFTSHFTTLSSHDGPTLGDDTGDPTCYINGVPSALTKTTGGTITMTLSPMSTAVQSSTMTIQCPHLLTHYELPNDFPTHKFKIRPNFSYLFHYADIEKPQGVIAMVPFKMEYIPTFLASSALVDDVLDTRFHLDYRKPVDHTKHKFNYSFKTNDPQEPGQILPGGVRLGRQYMLDADSKLLLSQKDVTKSTTLETTVQFHNTRTYSAIFGYIAQLKRPPATPAHLVTETSLVTYQVTSPFSFFTTSLDRQEVTTAEPIMIKFTAISLSSLQPLLKSGSPTFVFKEIEHKNESFKLSMTMNFRKPNLTKPLSAFEINLLPAEPTYFMAGDPNSCLLNSQPVKKMEYPQPFNATSVRLFPDTPIIDSKKALTLKCSEFFIHLPTHFKEDKFDKIPLEILGYSTAVAVEPSENGTDDDHARVGTDVLVQTYGLMKFVNPFLNNGQGATAGGVFAILGVVGLSLGVCFGVFLFLRWRSRQKRRRLPESSDAYEQLV